MRAKLLMVGAASLGLMASPALAGGQGLLGSSGNMGALLGGPSGGHTQSWGANNGGQKGGSWKGGESSQSSKTYNSNSETNANRNSGSEYKKSSFNLRDTTIGGVYANPQVDGSSLTKNFSASESNQGGGQKSGHGGGHYNSGGNHGGGGSSQASANASKKTFSASFPVAVESTTIGGFSSHKASGKTYDNSSYSNKESTSWKATQSHQSGGRH